MPRPSGLWLRKRDQVWMTTVNGVQHRLSKDKAEARRLLHRLLAGDRPAPARSGLTVRRVCDTYLTRTREGKDDGTHAVQVRHLKAFCEALGHRDPAALRVHQVEEWLESMADWAKTTKALSVTIIKAAFNFAVRQGYLAANPVNALRRRSTGRRVRVLTADERAELLEAVSEDFRDYLSVLEQTGCRPSEAARLTAGMVDWEGGRAVLAAHKNAKKGKRRAVYFPPPLLARLRELAARRPTGPLLRNRLGNAWTPGAAGKYVRRVAEKLGIEGAFPYAFRHTLASTALVKGVPVDVLAELIGNSPATLRNNYAHIEVMDDALRAAAAKAVS